MLKSLKGKIVVSHLLVAAAVAVVIGASCFNSVLKEYISLVVSVSFIFVAWGAKILAIKITAPLEKLSQASNSIAKGQFAKIKGVDVKETELVSLVDSFNKMTSNLSNLLISKDYVENLFQSIRDSIVIVDEEGRIKSANSATTAFLGYSNEELVGKPAGILFGEESGEGDIRKIRYHLKDNKAKDNFVATYETKSGAHMQVMISGSLLTDREGTGYDLVVVGKDITERRAQEAELQSIVIQLEQSNRELQDFAHIASHDLQEPLRKIMAFGERLNSKYADTLGEQGQDYLKRMGNAAQRMQGLIQGLLMYSRVTTKAQPFKPVDLTSVTKEVLSDLEVRINETGGHIEAEDLPSVSADPLQMRQLFQNLIGNALKFNKQDEPPVVKISYNLSNNGNGSITSQRKHYDITVEDNGIGFDEQYANRIFGVFQRLHGRNEYEGSGIGLSICRKIVNRHGGSIKVQSAPGKGTKFTITLPGAAASDNHSETHAAETQPA